MSGLIDRARRSPTGWLLACVVSGSIGALVGTLVSWAAGWPAPIAVVLGTGLGLLLAVRALRRPADSIAVVPTHANLDAVRSGLAGLRWFDEADARAEALAATIDDEVAGSMGWSPAQVRALAAMGSDPARLAAQGFLAVVEPAALEPAADGAARAVAGVVSLTHEPAVPSTARVGIWLGPGARGRGLGPEALRLAVGLAWQMGLQTVVGGTTVDNVAMRRTFLAVGADLAETVPHELPDGRTVDSCWYELHRPGHLD